ncbi:sulfurtransferase [Streptomyces sp. 6N106]|uniref:sulfurtransferase n=1 Tax=Streptomyces sp. 6N106 TaxID=3457418 RepID=UPI003FD2760B
MLQAAGHEAVVVLDGGLQKRVRENRPVETGEITPVPAEIAAVPRDGMWADKQDIMDMLGETDRATLIAAAPYLPEDISEIPAGAVRVMSRVIPGSVSVPYPAMAQPGSTALQPTEQREHLLAAVPKGAPAIVYCASGLSAPLIGLSLVSAGHKEVKIYDGSLDEWLSDARNPTESRVRPS